MSRQAKREMIEEQAAVWAARLEGGCMTDADRAALSTWLDTDPDHRWVLSRYRELSADITQHAEGRVSRPRRRTSWPRWSAAGAAAVLFFSLFLGRPLRMDTDTAERYAATLGDGSRIELNAQSAVSIDLRRTERRVRLSRGEALFEVAKDGRPFVVETPAGDVRVTGTVFNVRSARSAERIEVTVIEGSVSVAPNTESAGEVSLLPTNQALLHGGRVEVRQLSREATQDVVAWRQGQVVLAETPLAEVVEQFAAYHKRALTVSPEVAQLRLGGRLSLYDLDGMLALIERVLPVNVVRQPNGAIVVTAAR